MPFDVTQRGQLVIHLGVIVLKLLTCACKSLALTWAFNFASIIASLPYWSLPWTRSHFINPIKHGTYCGLKTKTDLMYCPISQMSYISHPASLAYDGNISEQSVPVGESELKWYKYCHPAGRTTGSSSPKVSESCWIYCEISASYAWISTFFQIRQNGFWKVVSLFTSCRIEILSH